jgi:hypothetical protein
MKKVSKDFEDAKASLLKLFQDDIDEGEQPIIYYNVRHVASSGMLRYMNFYFIGKDRKPVLLNWYIEKLGLWSRGKSFDSLHGDCLRVSGCGMDMGFHVVYTLSRLLYKDEFYCLGKNNCGSNDHVNGDKNYKINHLHSDAGYLLGGRAL